MSKCLCIPWDFPLKITNKLIECDVFGRTCFFNAIKQYEGHGKDMCPHCKDACEFMEYKIWSIKEKEFIPEKLYSWTFYQHETCKPMDICEYLHDVNDTIEPKSWFEALGDDNIYAEKKSKVKNANKLLKDHIIVHVSFPSDQVEKNVLDARYSNMKKVVKFNIVTG